MLDRGREERFRRVVAGCQRVPGAGIRLIILPFPSPHLDAPLIGAPGVVAAVSLASFARWSRLLE